MFYKKKFFSPKGKILDFYLFYYLFVVNDLIIKSSKLATLFWDLAKNELFYLSGYCMHTGSCCQNMAIMHNGQWIDNLGLYIKLIQKHPKYKQFKPVFSSENKTKIKYYACTKRSKNNYCTCYEERPQLCKNYPLSNFMLHNTIPKTCGYKIRKKNISPKIKNKNFLARYNNITS
jgi:uncharacterized protein